MCLVVCGVVVILLCFPLFDCVGLVVCFVCLFTVSLGGASVCIVGYCVGYLYLLFSVIV